MNITANITAGMSTQEKELFFKHQEMRHKQEAEKLEQEKESLKAYKKKLIADVLKCHPNLDPEYVRNLSIRTLERIW